MNILRRLQCWWCGHIWEYRTDIPGFLTTYHGSYCTRCGATQNLVGNLETCQDDLAEMTQRRNNLASELAEAIEALVDVQNIASRNDDFYRTYKENV